MCEFMITMPNRKPKRYAPPSPIIRILKKFNNKSNDRIKKKYWLIIGSVVSPKFFKANMTISEYEISIPFNPSTKLLPLIKISKQNDEKRYANSLLLNIVSNNSILELSIFKSVIITNDIIKKIWNKNLIFAETNIFRSEKKPIKKIAPKKETKIKSFE